MNEIITELKETRKFLDVIIGRLEKTCWGMTQFNTRFHTRDLKDVSWLMNESIKKLEELTVENNKTKLVIDKIPKIIKDDTILEVADENR